MPFPFEVQIRTWEMHRTAEYGIAAHWRYKEGRNANDDLDSKLYWVRQILEWQNEARDGKEFVDTLKTDLFAEEVFLFTPKGDVISMPKGATPLDFAYRVHSAVVGVEMTSIGTSKDSPFFAWSRTFVMKSAFPVP